MTSTVGSKLPYDPAEAEADGIELVGYHNLEGREAFKLGLHVVGDRWFLYGGSLWHPGVSVLDVTDPSDPTFVKWLPGPADTFTFQVQVADGKLINGLERPYAGYGRDTSQAREGFDIYDLSNPVDPILLGSWSTGPNRTAGPTTHREVLLTVRTAISTTGDDMSTRPRLPQAIKATYIGLSTSTIRSAR